MVAFTSLVVAGIKPVIDFGWMMTAGIVVAFLISFTLVPALIALLPELNAAGATDEMSMTRRFAAAVERFGGTVIVVTGLLVVLVAIGLSRLQVENRFIDYFKDTTEIYQGMELWTLGSVAPYRSILFCTRPRKSQRWRWRLPLRERTMDLSMRALMTWKPSTGVGF